MISSADEGSRRENGNLATALVEKASSCLAYSVRIEVRNEAAKPISD